MPRSCCATASRWAMCARAPTATRSAAPSGLAMIEAGEPITPACLNEGRWEIDIAGKRYPAEVSLQPLYDPEMKRIKGVTQLGRSLLWATILDIYRMGFRLRAGWSQTVRAWPASVVSKLERLSRGSMSHVRNRKRGTSVPERTTRTFGMCWTMDARDRPTDDGGVGRRRWRQPWHARPQRVPTMIRPLVLEARCDARAAAGRLRSSSGPGVSWETCRAASACGWSAGLRPSPTACSWPSAMRPAAGARITYEETSRAANAIGQSLLDRGLGPDRPRA